DEPTTDITTCTTTPIPLNPSSSLSGLIHLLWLSIPLLRRLILLLPLTTLHGIGTFADLNRSHKDDHDFESDSEFECKDCYIGGEKR
ncbi:hypothetical protein MIMGU_mgv1a0212572mg, partial [Erythranthe guttata]